MSEKWPETPPPYHILGSNSLERDEVEHMRINNTKLPHEATTDYERIINRLEWKMWWNDVGIPMLFMSIGAGLAYWGIHFMIGQIILSIFAAFGMPMAMWMNKKK